MHQSPTAPDQNVDSTLFEDLLLTWFERALKSLREGTPVICAACRLYPKSTPTKNPHHTRQLSLTFDVSSMCPQSYPIPWIEYHSRDIVHSIKEKPLSTDCDSPGRADTPKERCNEVAGKVIGSRVRHVAIAVAVSELLLCFIKLILGNRYGTGLSSRVTEGGWFDLVEIIMFWLFFSISSLFFFLSLFLFLLCRHTASTSTI